MNAERELQADFLLNLGLSVRATNVLSQVDVKSASLKILKVLKEHGPVLQTSKFEEHCLSAGVNHHSFWIYLSDCPIITRRASGVYGLRGAEVPAGQVESLIPKRTARSKLLVDHGWTKDRNIQIVYRVSSGMLSNGVVSVPAALRPFLQGRYALVTGDNSTVGAIVVKENSAWGLGPLFTRRGGEPGDYLSIIFDSSKRLAVAQTGDASLADELAVPASTDVGSERESE
jgi:hypothetical protein